MAYVLCTKCRTPQYLFEYKTSTQENDIITDVSFGNSDEIYECQTPLCHCREFILDLKINSLDDKD